MSKYQLNDLIDINQIKSLQDRLYDIYPVPTSIKNLSGEIISSSGGEDLCNKFHRRHPDSSENCLLSDKYISDSLAKKNPSVNYKCPHGLIDCAFPVIIDDIHYGNFYAGHIFVEKPDSKYFEKTADELGFDKPAYLEEISKVPLLEEEALNKFIAFVKELLGFLAAAGLKKIKELEAVEISRANEEQFKSIFEYAPVGVVLVGLDGSFIRTNHAFEEMIGYSREELKGMTFRNITHPDSIDESNEIVLNLIEGKTDKIDFEKKYIKKEGEDIWVSVRTIVKRKPDGAPEYFITHLRNVSEERKSKLELVKNEERFRTVAECAGVWVWEVDTEGVYTFSSASIESILGYKPEEIIGKKKFYELFAATPGDLITNKAKAGFEERIQFRNFENPNVHKNGQIIFLETSGIPQYDSKGAFTGYRGADRDITERKTAEFKLQDSLERVSVIFRQSPMGIALTRISDGIIIEANDEFASIHGYTREEMIGKSTLDLNLWVDNDERDFVVKELKEKGACRYYECKARKKNGEIRLLKMSAELIQRKGETYAIGIGEDITEIRNAENRVKESDERYRSIFENNHSAIIVLDPETGNIVDANPAAEKFYGWSLKELCSMKISHLNPAPPEVIKNALFNASHKIESHFYFKHRIADGTVKDIEAFAGTLTRQGKLLIFAFIIDLTERMKAEVALQEIRAKLDTAIESMTDAVFITDNQGNFIHFNEAFVTIHRFGSKEECKKQLSEYPDILEVYMDSGELAPLEMWAVPRALRGESVKYAEYSLRRKDTGEKWFGSYSFSPIRDTEGNITGSVVVGRDITEHKLAEAELEKHRYHLEELVQSRTEEIDAINRELINQIMQKQEAEEALKVSLEKEKELNQLKSRFISTTSHEFKTPLSAVLSSAELIERYGHKWGPEKIADHIERIKNSVMHLSKLVDDVLQLSRAESGRLEYTPIEIDLKTFCGKVIEEMHLSSKEKHRINFEYKSGRNSFMLDQKQTYIILQNLLSNAVKYSPAGGKVDLIVDSDELNLRIVVNDEGVGIPETDIDKLFQPFHRAANTGGIEGTGLGLSIMKKAVELHGGTVVVKSELGKGTSFIVEIPL